MLFLCSGQSVDSCVLVWVELPCATNEHTKYENYNSGKELTAPLLLKKLKLYNRRYLIDIIDLLFRYYYYYYYCCYYYANLCLHFNYGCRDDNNKTPIIELL
jgi:hypothetical protein